MRTTLKNLILAGIAGLALSFFTHAAPVSAAATPESCFEFRKADGVVAITGYYDNEANNSANPACSRDVEIPATIGGQAVESIVNSDGAYNFNGRSLTSLTIANGVKEIGGSYAFANNKLTSISLPPSNQIRGLFCICKQPAH